MPSKKQEHTLDNVNMAKRATNEMPPKNPHCVQDADIARRIKYQNQLFKAKKLTLVLDLDETLLHSIYFKQLDATYEIFLRKKEKVDKNASNPDLFRFDNLGCWTKLRPGVRNFLDEANKLFELHVNTMAGQIYGRAMVKILDPTGNLFDKRVIFNGDTKKKLIKKLDGVMSLQSTVLIVDDTPEVWSHNQRPNLIQVKKYTYLQHEMLKGDDSLLDIESVEKHEADILSSLLALPKRIHRNFFAQRRLDEVDVRNILANSEWPHVLRNI